MTKYFFVVAMLVFSMTGYGQDERPGGTDGTGNLSGHVGGSLGGGGNGGATVTADDPTLGAGGQTGTAVTINPQGTPATRSVWCCAKKAGPNTILNASILVLSPKPHCRPNDNAKWKLIRVPAGTCVNGKQ